MIHDLIRIIHMDVDAWLNFPLVMEWRAHDIGLHRGWSKAMTLLVMLVCWELWNERNVRVFHNCS